MLAIVVTTHRHRVEKLHLFQNQNDLARGFDRLRIVAPWISLLPPFRQAVLNSPASEIEKNGLDFAGGVQVKEYKGLLGMITLILLDKDDNPSDLCEQERVKLHSEYNILGIRQLFRRHEPKSEQEGAALTPGFMVVLLTCHPRLQ